MADRPKSSKSQGFALLETIFAITAFVLMWIGSMHCDFIQFTGTSGNSNPISLKFGIWYYQYWSYLVTTDGNFVFESCHSYPDYVNIDGTWKSARAFSVMAFIPSMVLLVAAIVSACPGKKMVRGWMAPTCMVACLCQGLTLLLLNSNVCNNNQLVKGISANQLNGITFPDTCSIGVGAKYVISATVFWFVAGLASFASYRAGKAEEAVAAEDAGLSEPLVGP